MNVYSGIVAIADSHFSIQESLYVFRTSSVDRYFTNDRLTAEKSVSSSLETYSLEALPIPFQSA